MNQLNPIQWTEVAHSLGKEFAGRAELSDESDSFVSDNYARAQSSTRVRRGDPGRIGRRRRFASPGRRHAAHPRPVLRLDGAGAVDASASGRRDDLEVAARPGRRTAAQKRRRKTARAGQHRRRRLARVQRHDDQNRRRLSGQRQQTFCQSVRGRRHAGHQRAVHGP